MKSLILAATMQSLAIAAPSHTIDNTMQSSSTNSDITYPSPQVFANQRQDHFSGDNANVWGQYYYVNDTFWKGATSNAPIFLCVGGEGPAFDGSVVVDSVHCSNAAN